MRKTRVVYFIIVYDERGRMLHEQYIMPNELHLIATFFKHHKDAFRIDVTRDELSPEHWLFT